jgi:hypothetical protein
MTIDYGRLRSLTAREPGETFPPKTLKRIIEDQAHWTEEDLGRLNLL